MYKNTILRSFVLIMILLATANVYSGDNTTPTRLFSKYINGNNNDCVNVIKLDSDGNIIIAGKTNSNDQIAGSDGYQNKYGGGDSDAFIQKLTASGDIVWSTYLGGANTDEIVDLCITGDDKIIVCGNTNSEDDIFSSSGFQNEIAGSFDCFISCFNKNGQMEWSSFFGGTERDIATALAIDNDENIIVTGYTYSSGLASQGAYQEQYNAEADAFLLKINTGIEIDWVTYLGGDSTDISNAVAISEYNHIIIGGSTNSSLGISSFGSYQRDYSGNNDGFISSFADNGELLWSTYSGGPKEDCITDIVCDKKNYILAAGYTRSRDGIKTEDEYFGTITNKAAAGMILKYYQNGTKYYGNYYSYLENMLKDEGISTMIQSIDCDNSNSYIIAGTTIGSGLATDNAWQVELGGKSDAFATKFNEEDVLIWASFYGGAENDSAFCLCIDDENNLFLAGNTASTDNISENNQLDGETDGFLAKLTGFGNALIDIEMANDIYFPLDILISKSEKNDDEYESISEITIMATNELPAVLDVSVYDCPFKITVVPHNSEICSSFDLFVPDREELLSLEKWIPSAFPYTDVHDTTRTGNIFCPFTNYGMFGLDVDGFWGEFAWPKEQNNLYIFGMGFWFGTQKRSDETGELRKMLTLTFDPQSGLSYMSPGRYYDNAPVSKEYGDMYKAWNSLDYDKITGENLHDNDAPNWPLWYTDKSREQKNFGSYIAENDMRNNNVYSGGPVMLSDEQIFTTYYDGILEMHPNGIDSLYADGYPIGLQCEQNFYLWNTGDLKDAMIVSYKIINVSNDTLFNSWFAPVCDYDIQNGNMSHQRVDNDRGVCYYLDGKPDIYIAWTEISEYEANRDFGYMGLSLIETPAIDETGFIINEITAKDAQLGMKTCQTWDLSSGNKDLLEKFDLISSGTVNHVDTAGDLRVMFSTGPFNMLPGDTIKVSMLINFAMPAKGGEPDGSNLDFADLISRKTAAEEYWYNIINPVDDNKVYSDDSFVVQPNPSTGNADIYFQPENPGYYSIDIYNLAGEKVLTPVLNRYLDSESNKINIDLHHLVKGTYYVCISNGEMSVCSRLIKI